MRVFVLVQGVFVLVQGVFILVQGVFVLVHRVFVLVHRVFVLVQGVLGLRSSFLGLRFSNTPGRPSSLQELGRDSCLRAVLCYKRLSTNACMGCKRFFLKERKNVMFLNNINLPYCPVVFFVVYLRLRPFWSFSASYSYFGVPLLRERQDRTGISGLSVAQGNNSTGKLPLASIPLEIQSRDVAVPSPFTQFTIPPRSFTSDADRIVCRVTKIGLARVASSLQMTSKPISSQCGLDKTSRGDPGT